MATMSNIFRSKTKLNKELTKTVTVDSIPSQTPASFGLCKQLVVHQNCIMQQVEIITNSLEPDSETKPSSYGTVVTQLLIQLDGAMSITQKCLTKEVYERNARLKSLLKEKEQLMYSNVALLVKWADFSGWDKSYSIDKNCIYFYIKEFKAALNDFVRLVVDNSSPPLSTTPTSHLTVDNNKSRRASLNDAVLNKVVHDPPDTPTSMGVALYSTPGVPTRSRSEKNNWLVRSHDSLNSDSGDSDITNTRRSEYTDGIDHTHNSLPNGSYFPGETRLNQSNSRSHIPSTVPFTNITNGDSEKAPPIPIKKRRQHQLMGSAHSSPTHSSAPSFYVPPVPMRSPNHHVRKPDTEPPPPIPIKRRGTTPVVNPPPTPIRIDSIDHNLRERLAQGVGTPPEKPPRSDLGGFANMQAGPYIKDGNKLLQMLDDYNVAIMINESIKNKQIKEDKAPPIPPKKKDLLLAQHLFERYTFDDSSIPSLSIPDMTAPPPLPPKKRKNRKPEPVHQHNPARRETSPLANGISSKKGGSVGSQDDLSSDELDPTEEPVNFLEVDDVTPYLKFQQDDKGFTLQGGPLDALIAYAASTSSSVKHYTEAFLSTYYTLITSDDLIFKLLKRMQYFYKEGNTSLWQATISLLVRVLNSMKTPLHKKTENLLIELLHNTLRDGQLKFAMLVRGAIVEKLNQKVPEFMPLSKVMCSNSKPTKVITDFDAQDVAKQLTILDADYFFRVDIQEMLYWAKDHNEEQCPQLTLFTTHFNDVSQWFQTRLLEKDMEWKKREKLMMFFINVMKALLREYNNFNSYLAILSAIESANVSRLDWSDKISRGLEEPRMLIDSRGSFKNYRQAFATTKPPCIPYIGLYLQDLTFLEEQPTKLDDKISINFGKRWKQFKSVDHIRFAQTKLYTLDVDPAIMGVFNGFKDQENTDDLYKRSLQIKPRKTAAQ